MKNELSSGAAAAIIAVVVVLVLLIGWKAVSGGKGGSNVAPPEAQKWMDKTKTQQMNSEHFRPHNGPPPGYVNGMPPKN